MLSARPSDGAGNGKGTDMPGEATQMQQAVDMFVAHPAHPRTSYLGRVLSKARALVMPARRRPRRDQQPDGMEAFDMLGGWKGLDDRRRNIG